MDDEYITKLRSLFGLPEDEDNSSLARTMQQTTDLLFGVPTAQEDPDQ